MYRRYRLLVYIYQLIRFDSTGLWSSEHLKKGMHNPSETSQNDCEGDDGHVRSVRWVCCRQEDGFGQAVIWEFG
jgi:hypothetical protein